MNRTTTLAWLIPLGVAAALLVSPWFPAADALGQTASKARRAPLVDSGDIRDISPNPIVPGQPFRVSLVLKSPTRLPAEKLLATLRVDIDGATAARDGRGELALLAGNPRDISSVTLLVVAPASLPADRGFGLMVFSTIDGQPVARAMVRTAGAARAGGPVAVPKKPAATPTSDAGGTSGVKGWTPTAGQVLLVVLGLVVIGIAARAYVVVSAGRQAAADRIRELELAVQAERQKAAGGNRRESAEQGEQSASPQPSAPELPPEVIAALSRRDLVLVLGPGVSAQSGLPTTGALWLNVLDRNAERIPGDQLQALRRLMSAEGPESAIESIVSMLERPTVMSALSEELRPAKAKPSHFHELLARLPVPAIIDTNWDGMMAQALAGREVATFGPGRPQGISEGLRAGQLVLLKPWGELGDPASLVLTAADYRRTMSQTPELERSIAALYSTRTLLFLGFGLRGLEQFLASLPAELESAGRTQHFAVVRERANAGLWEAGLGRRYGVRLVQYRPSPDFRELVVAAQALVASVPPTDSLATGAGGEAFVKASRLTYLWLESIGVFPRLRLDFSPGWTLLLGNNGGGKSTILRATALALAGNDRRALAPARRLLRAVVGNGAGGEAPRTGTIELGVGSTTLVTKLVPDGHSVLLKSPQTTPLQGGQILVLAFPALRGVTTRDVRGPTSMDAANPSVDDVAPLLEGVVDSRLDDLQQWVVNTALRAEGAPGGREAKMLETFQQLIAGMVPGGGVEYAEVDRDSWEVILLVDGVRVPLAGVSQGMSSILNWVGVLLQRLYDVYPRSENPEREPAVVLIDEIDAHLHPKWQRRLVALTREHFPNVQIVASSHSPLLAGAVEHGEVRVVAKNEDTGEIEAVVPREDLSGQKAEDILVSSLFSLETTRSVEAQQTIHEYFELFHQTALSPEKRKRLDELSLRLQALNYGPTLAERRSMAEARKQLDTDLATVSADDVRTMLDRLRASPAEAAPDSPAKGGTP